MAAPTQDQKPARKTQAADMKAPMFRAVYGLMVHPFTSAHFDQNSEVEHVEDSWVTSQVEAGKLLKV